MMIAELEQIQLFKELDSQSLSDIAKFCTKLELTDGEILISENDADSIDLFILCDGKVEILSNSSGITSSEITLSKQEKELFGEVSWLTGRKRTATIRSHGPVEAIRVDGKKLATYLESNTKAGFIIMHIIANLLADSLNHTDQLLKQILWNTNL